MEQLRTLGLALILLPILAFLLSGQTPRKEEFRGRGVVAQEVDFDGDGKTDIGIYRPLTGEWILCLSTRHYVATAGNWHL